MCLVVVAEVERNFERRGYDGHVPMRSSSQSYCNSGQSFTRVRIGQPTAKHAIEQCDTRSDRGRLEELLLDFTPCAPEDQLNVHRCVGQLTVAFKPRRCPGPQSS
jgi:hypothetical protein